MLIDEIGIINYMMWYKEDIIVQIFLSSNRHNFLDIHFIKII